MRATEFVRRLNEIHNAWIEDINGETSYLNYAYVAESVHQGKVVEENDKLYLDGLHSDEPILGNKYAFILVICFPESRVSLHGTYSSHTLTDTINEDGTLMYKFSNGKKYPVRRNSKMSFMRTFLLSNEDDITELLSALTLKFKMMTKVKLDEKRKQNESY